MSQNVNSTGSATEKKIGYSSEAELLKEFKQFLTVHPTSKDTAANYLYHSLVDDMILGLVLEVHHAWRLGLLDDALEEQSKNCAPYSGENSSIFNVFDRNPPTKKSTECICSHCGRTVAASTFATHLQRCMGMQPCRQASRLTRQRLATREGTTYYGTHASDDDDDEEISEKRKRRNNSNVKSNGKRNGKTS
ncbi:SAGA-associated factor 11 homolog [Condylostylus longicornis]|uniref:SAGA-associated factor 11 homolog n=1 Tax=Condylostylus longicornis TaxID=2530218 RepID=UPI00244E596E|nr:SAGA-associated factor 11 homolog [Condylostylus longicornis]XP_055371614.1 SAGA-associated factor 11 homolog [Condylostylus longicornis]